MAYRLRKWRFLMTCINSTLDKEKCESTVGWWAYSSMHMDDLMTCIDSVLEKLQLLLCMPEHFKDDRGDRDLMTCIGSIFLEKLQLLVCKRDCHKDDLCLNKLKVEIRLVKTFLLFAVEYIHNEQLYTLLGRLRDGLLPIVQQFYTCLHGLEDRLLPSDLARAASKFRQVINSFKQEICEAYFEMSGCILQGITLLPGRMSHLFRSSCLGEKFIELFSSLLENLEDILIWAKETHDSRLESLLEPLQEKLLFINNFIHFVRMQGCEDNNQLMEHGEVVAVSAAYFCYCCWFYRDDHQVFDRMELKISELIEKIKPVDPLVRVAYIGVLVHGPFTLSTERDMSTAGNFVDSLLSSLRDLINHRTSFIVHLEHQMQILYERLQFLRNFLMKHHEKYNGLHARINYLIGAVVNNAGVMIFSLYQTEMEEASTREIDVKLFRLLEEIEHIKAEVEDLMTCIDSALDELQLHKDDHGLSKLKVELRLLKTFFLHARRSEQSWCLHEPPVHRGVPQFYTLLVGLKDGLLLSNLDGTTSRFQQVIKSFKQQISELYVQMSDDLLSINYLSRSWRSEPYSNSVEYCLKEATYPLGDDAMEYFHSSLGSIVDILIWGQACDSMFETLLEPLQEKLIFLHNFIHFVRMQGKYSRYLMEHCQLVAVSAAYICHLCWFCRDDDEVFDGMHLKISQLIEKISPVDHQVRVAFIGIIEFGSFTLSTKINMFIVGNFVDSLLCNLWELLLNCGSSFMVSLEHQMRILCEGLQFLRNIFMKHQEKYHGLHERKKELIGAVVNDAGVVILSLYQSGIEEASAKEIDVKLFCLLEKIKLIKTEVEEKHPVTLRVFPVTNELGFIDLLLENLKELASCKVNSISFAEDRVGATDNYRLFLESYLKKTVVNPTRYPKHIVQSVQDDLVFFTSLLNNYMEEHNQHEHLQVQTMQDDLAFLRSFLQNKLELRNQHEDLQALWSYVIEVAYKAEFVIESLLVGDISLYSLASFHNLAEEIKLVKTKTLEIDDKKYDIEAEKATRSSRDVPSLGSISTINEVVDVLKDEVQAIIDQLIGGSKQFNIVSIVGIPGVGKTTLAQKVYHDSSIKSHFHVRAWCCISQVYCTKDLLLEIWGCIHEKAQYSAMNEDDLADKLRKHLKEKKYLIVLDDVWDTEVWDALKIVFPDDTNGSRVLLTNRDREVALSVKPTGEPHHLRLLTDEESWELLQKKLEFATKEDYPPALCFLGRQIAKKCNGLPLSIVIISGILTTLDQVSWEEVGERLSSNMLCGTEQCKSVLELSYMHLPDYLKPCLLYFAAFQEDEEIPIRRLMWLLIAEGFVPKNDRKSLERMAEDYIMALINRSLVIVGQQRSTGGVKTCRIHDLLHEFCLAKAKDKSFLQLIQGHDEFCNFDEPDNLHRLCIHSQPQHFWKSRLFCPRIRSILFFSCGPRSSRISNNLSFIFHLKLLRVLDLEQITLGLTFPSEIAVLVRLRFLALRGGMKDIPSSIKNLSHLETFLVTMYYYGSGKFTLPDSFFVMQKLRHLHLRGALVDLSFAKNKLDGSSNLNNLCTFSTPELCLGQSMEKMLRKFPNIRNLKCSLPESEESTGDSNRIVVMDFLSQLESLKLLLRRVTVHHLEFHLPSTLKKLTLVEFSWSIISTIGKLRNLEVLKLLRQADRVKKWEMGNGRGGFP
ncbi:hypothetical protein ACH5RR_021302 [Cinchona calisaya]|uniref:Uncharacterized protein n=1 Tax=Cinchona calisaya TaxID=153742 RepID=A0ABD2ZH41_9GENT